MRFKDAIANIQYKQNNKQQKMDNTQINNIN